MATKMGAMVNVRLSEKLAAQVEREAGELELSVSDVVRLALRAWFERTKKGRRAAIAAPDGQAE